MKTTRRSAPLPVLLILAPLLFSAGLITGWTSAPAHNRPLPKNLDVPNSAPAENAPPLPTPTPVPPLDKPASGEDWALVLVNAGHPLPRDFAVPELTWLRGGHAIDQRAYPALQAMMDATRSEGLQPLICSSYRSEETQRLLFEQEVQTWRSQGYAQKGAEEQAARWVARPGASEHQLGLAVDIVDTSYQVLDQGQESTPVQRWLMTHCADYGFILRYPTGKSALTGVGYEPWHYRYVGKDAAAEIHEAGVCLEEYLEQADRPE